MIPVALALGCDPATAIPGVRAGDRDAYVCVAGSDDARDVLVAAIDGGGEHGERVTRGLALWLLHHDEAAWDPALVRRLGAADRRLLADGVRARRGRRSPVPAHDQVFAQFAWYEPADGYTDGRLRPYDRGNIRLADAPPPAPVADDAPVPPPASADTEPVCGCSGGAAALLFPLLLPRRRR